MFSFLFFYGTVLRHWWCLLFLRHLILDTANIRHALVVWFP